MEKQVGFTEMFEIEQKIFNIYQKLIELSDKKGEEYRKQVENLALLEDYEQEKFDIFIKNLDRDYIYKYSNMYNTTFDTHTPEIIDIKKLYKYRLAINMISAQNSIDSDNCNKFVDNFMTELAMNYIWNIDKKKNESNKDIITKIQYYNCFIDRKIESFFIDNFFDFTHEYKIHTQSIYDDEEKITYSNVSKEDVKILSASEEANEDSEVEEKIDSITGQIEMSLEKLKEIKEDTLEYLCEETLIKSIAQTAYEGELDGYYEYLKEQEQTKYSIVQKILKSK